MTLAALPYTPNLADGTEVLVNIDRAICSVARAIGETNARHQGTLAGLTERMDDLVRMRGEIIRQNATRAGP